MSLLKTIFPGQRTSWSPATEEDWLLAERASDDGVSLLRIRRLPSGFSFHDFPHRLSITWTYQQGSQNGAPTEDEMEFMQRFETRVAEGIEARSAALLALVFTEANQRQYDYYCPSVNKFIKLLNRMPEESADYPITIAHEEDPSGLFYDACAKAVY